MSAVAEPDARPRSSRTELCAALLVAAAVVLVAPWRPIDPDTLSNLAVGRAIAAAGAVPTSDPLTFSAPERRFATPEWLGDLAWHLCYRAAGDAGLLALKLSLLCLGWVLLLRLAARQGAAPLLAAALILLALLGAAPRFTERNDLHCCWLIPLFGLVLERARERRAWLAALAPLGVLWANLHSSFVLGWAVVAAELLQAAVERRSRRDLGLLAAALAAQPLCALVSPCGLHNLDQIVDHLRGAAVYRQIVEWQTPLAARPLVQLPLHLLAALGALSLLPRVNRRRVGPPLLVLLGAALAYSAQRFIPLLALLALPAVATNLTRWSATAAPRLRHAGLAALLLVAVGLLAPLIWAARLHAPPHLLERDDAPLAIARQLARAPTSLRLFSPYNAGPWLLWLAGPRVQLYIDPRNNLGAETLRRYLALLADPGRFEAEARRLRFDLALVDADDGRMATLGDHLRRSTAWLPISTDGRYQLYARVEATRLDAMPR